MARRRKRDRLLRLLRDPLGVVRDRLRLAYQVLRYGGLEGERGVSFWSSRHTEYGADDLRGVGRESWSHEENAREYAEAGRVVLEACRAAQVSFESARVLDIGCGTGFYTGLFREAGVRDYTGVDIAPTLLPTLTERFEGYRFEQVNIAERAPGGTFDLVLFIDVTQHLVTDEAFSAALANVRSCLAPGGLLLVTSWGYGPEKLSFIEVARPVEAYTEHFPAPDYELTGQYPFRTKHLLAIRRQG